MEIIKKVILTICLTNICCQIIIFLDEIIKVTVVKTYFSIFIVALIIVNCIY